MSKWVEIGDIKQPAAAVAAEILQSRMEHAQQMLPLAAWEYRDDIEHVHQLRVGCRRAGAAVQAFQPLLKNKSKSLRKWLRKLRQAAGPARDVDVLLDRLHVEPDARPCHAYVVARLDQQRANVQQRLTDVAEHAESGRLDDSVERCLTALRKRAKKKNAARFDKFARRAMQVASQRMFRLAGQQDASIAELHQLRIAGKRLRYSIEIFHSAFSESLQMDVYPLVESIQSRLGQLNDHATAQALYQHWLIDLPPDERAAQLAARIVEEYQATDQVRHDFLQWWTPQRVAELESHLESLIHS